MKRTIDPIQPAPARRAAAVAAMLLLALFLASGPARTGPGDARISGNVVDQEGEPVVGLKVLLVPDDSALLTLEARTNKKGRFVLPAVRPKPYRPQIESDTFMLDSLSASVRGSDGAMLKGFEEDNARVNGSPLMEIPPAGRITMKLVVAPMATREPDAGTGTLHGISGATGDLERLNALFELSKWDELIGESQTYIETHPDDGGAVYLRAVALWQSGSLEQATEQFSLAQELIPEQHGLNGTIASCLLEYGNALEAEGRADEATARFSAAVEALEKQLLETPDSMTHLINYVIACEKAGRMEEAIATLQHIIEIEPERVDVQVRLGELLTDAGRAPEAIEIFSNLPGGDAEQIADRIYNAAILLWNAGKVDETIAAMEAAIGLAPGNLLLHRLLGRTLVQKGDDAGALAALREAVRLAPDDPVSETDRQLIEALEKKLGS